MDAPDAAVIADASQDIGNRNRVGGQDDEGVVSTMMCAVVGM